MKKLPSKPNTAAVTAVIPKDAGRAHLVWNETIGKFLQVVSHGEYRGTRSTTHMFIHITGNVRHVEVGIALVRKLLELCVE
jgi:hypothetical protein